MSPYEENYLRTMAGMNDAQKEDYKEAHKWLKEHWKEYTDEDFLDSYDFWEAPDEKREIYRNDSVKILYADEYDYFEIILLDEE